MERNLEDEGSSSIESVLGRTVRFNKEFVRRDVRLETRLLMR